MGRWCVVVAFILSALAMAQEPVELDEYRQPAIKTNGNCFIKGGTIWTGMGQVIEGGSILVRDGKIAAIGKDLTPPDGIPVIDATGKFIMPGIIDAHSHIATDAVNEGTDSITAEVRIHDVLVPQSLSIYRALAGGVTAALILHGSANAIGGQSVVVKMKWRQPAERLIIPDAPRIIKFALGENPKRSNFTGETVRFPTTRLGVEAVIRRAFDEARRYMKAWERYERERQRNPHALPPRRDLRLETLADILRGNIWVHCHAYRADEMLMLVRLAKEYGFKIAAFQHALEAYKIAPELAAAGVGVSTFADYWAYKVEAYDAIPYNAAICLRAGIITSVNSDSGERMRRLNLEAAKCIKYGDLTPEEALRLITLYPAMQLGIAHRTGTLEVGKDADISIWDGHPLSVYSKCVMTLVDGEVLFMRRDAFGVDKTATVRRELSLCRTDHLALPTPPPARRYAIVGATVYPITQPPIENGVVLIEGDRIKAVGKNVAIPKDAIVINAKGLRVYPGLIDAGSVLGLTEISAVRATVDTSESGDFQPDLQALVAVNPASEHFAITRFVGITAALTRPTGGVISGQSAVIHLAGWTPDEMRLKSPAALHLNVPEGLGGLPSFVRLMMEPQQIQQLLEESGTRLQRLRDFLRRAKLYAEAKSKGAEVAFDPRFEAMLPYITGKLPVIFHANSARSIRTALQLADEFGLKAVIAGGRDGWKVADLLAQKKVPVIVGPLWTLPASDYDPYDAPWANPAVLHRAGVKIAFQSASAATARDLPYQVGIACAFGLPHEEALKAVTINAAEILGVADQLGSLEAGKVANLLVTDGDPLEVTTNLHYLFIAGKPVPLESRHTRLYLQYRQRLAQPMPLASGQPTSQQVSSSGATQ